MRPIDGDALKKSLIESADRCREWITDCMDAKDNEMQGRAEQALLTFNECIMRIDAMPTIEPERKKMSNKEWVDFLSEQFTVSRTSAREMLHGLMRWKAEDNFKKQFSGGRNEKE